ncbi:hypothetical protein [Mongoliibacter ruber]|nr:hypothetical protein [Mongoliibacter ruber]
MTKNTISIKDVHQTYQANDNGIWFSVRDHSQMKDFFYKKFGAPEIYLTKRFEEPTNDDLIPNFEWIGTEIHRL